MGNGGQGEGVGVIATSTGPEENLLRYRAQSWVLPSPWLWGGGRATWVDLRHRSRGA